MLGHNVLRHRLVLAIDDVHVEFPFASLDDGAQLGGILDAVVEGLEENAVEEARLVGEINRPGVSSLTLGAIHKSPRHSRTPSSPSRPSSHPAWEYHCWHF
jgi:hypothetical protein